MHELPFVQAVIKKASACAREHGAARVLSVSLVVGEGSGYVPESIQMYFDVASAGTPCARARLNIRRVKPLMRCAACGKEFERRPFSFDCPDCGGEGSPTDTGQELYIEEIELTTTEGEESNEGNDTRAGDGSDTHGERPAGRGDARGL